MEKQVKHLRSVKELMDLKGRCAIVTGGSGYLGYTFSDALAEMGSDIVLVDINLAKMNMVAKEIREKWNVNVNVYECNLEDEVSNTALVEEINKLESVDILVNNAAFAGTSDLTGWVVPFHEQSLATWRRALEVNITSVFYFCQKISPLLKQSPCGSIINVSSIYGMSAPDYRLYEGVDGMGNPAAYSASKGAVIQLTRWLSTTLAPDVRVNAISPGGIFRNQADEFVDRYVNKTPLARMATEEDFKGIIAYLASDLSAYVTGQNFVIDGGWTVW